MDITTADLITWLIVGGIAGPTIGLLVKRDKKGFGHLANLGVGLVGALIGGLLFAVIPIARPLAAISVNLEDLVSAVVGCVIFLLLLRFYRKKSQAAPANPA